MKKYLIILFLVASLSMEAQEVNWYSIEDAIEMTKKESKMIMVDVYATWCGPCKRMDEVTFHNEIIADYLNKTFYPVKLNAETKDSITVMDHTFKYVASGARGYHELAAALLNNQLSYPSIVFLFIEEGQLKILDVVKGAHPPESFDEILKYVGGKHYTSVPFDEWKASYNSPFAKN